MVLAVNVARCAIFIWLMYVQCHFYIQVDPNKILQTSRGGSVHLDESESYRNIGSEIPSWPCKGFAKAGLHKVER